MPPKGEAPAGDKPYRGGRAGAKRRKLHFYQAQDALIQLAESVQNIIVRRRNFEDVTEAHYDTIIRFGQITEQVDVFHPVWADLVEYYPELWTAFSDVTEEPATGSGARWRPKAAAKAAGSGGAASSEASGAPAEGAAPGAPAQPPTPPKAPALGIRGPTRDLYYRGRSDPLRQRRVPAEPEQIIEDTGARASSEPPAAEDEVDLSRAGGNPAEDSLRSARRVRTPPARRAQEEARLEELRLRGSVFASFRDAEDAEPEQAEQAEQAAGREETEEIEVEVEVAQGDDGGAAVGAPDDEPATEGRQAEGAEEEEAAEEDEAIDRRAVPPPRVQRTAHQGDAEEALSAPDPFDLPNDAWIDPHSYREAYTASGVPRGVSVARIDTSSEEEGRQRGAASGAPATPRAPPQRRPFRQGEIVEAEVEETATLRRRPATPEGEPPTRRPRVVLTPASKASSVPATASAPLRAEPIEAVEEAGPRERTRTPRRPEAAPPKGAAQAHRGRGRSGSWPPKRQASSSPEGAVSEGDSPRSRAPATKESLPKARQSQPKLPSKVPPTDRHGVKYKSPPVPAPPAPKGTAAQPVFKGPPHAVFVASITRGGQEQPKATSKAPPPIVTGNRQKLAYHAWAQQARDEENAQAAASSAAAASASSQRVLASRTEATIVFDWHHVLDKAWIESTGATWETRRGSHGYFNLEFVDALKAFCEEHKPLRLAILSYSTPSSSAWYRHHFLEEALECLRLVLPLSINLSIGQTYQRTGPDGKAQQLCQIEPPASLIIDDNRGIIKECAKTGALTVQAQKGGGVDQLIYELNQASALIKRTGRNNLPKARHLEPRELLYER
ncbi:unnamed protein product [Symbiodinium sp. CCMP2592]|nr:unnamed protein product [Symbiodinium sp. CCMP2592]